MALTQAEIQKRYRERLKAEKAKAPERTDEVLRRPFFQFLAEHGKWLNDADPALTDVGITPPEFDDDVDEFWERYGEIDRGSIGRAERMVGAFLDSAVALASDINRYKREEITRAITTIEQSDLTDPAARKKALAEMVRLTKLRDRLNKQVRWTLPEWKVKGD